MVKRPVNTLRIIGGKWRRRLLTFPDIEGLRPTNDRVRETLFNWLQPYITGARCLDLFAGSGALGFEAVSRGAGGVTFVDSHLEAIKSIEKNIDTLGIDRQKVETIHAQWPHLTAQQMNSPYDIVFLDPPFHNKQLHEIVEWLRSSQLLSEDALIYVESEKRKDEVQFSGWAIFKSGHTKRIMYSLYTPC